MEPSISAGGSGRRYDGVARALRSLRKHLAAACDLAIVAPSARTPIGKLLCEAADAALAGWCG